MLNVSLLMNCIGPWDLNGHCVVTACLNALENPCSLMSNLPIHSHGFCNTTNVILFP
jgi:hypothetical protein